MTSLLPAWNYNPEDAAAFAAGQDIAMGEEQNGGQAAQLGGADADAGGGVGGQGEAAPGVDDAVAEEAAAL